MRVRLSDGTGEVELEAEIDPKNPHLHKHLELLEAMARRLYADTMREPERRRAPFGFSLDGVSLDATTERAEPYYEPGRDDYDDEDDQ